MPHLPPRLIKFSDWPALERELWVASDSRKGLFVINPRRLAAETLRKWMKGYCRWLAFLRDRGWLDPDIHPADRITPERLDAYFQELQISGNADHTIIGRFVELCSAAQRLAPDRDMGWVRKPFGATIWSLLPKRKRTFVVPDSGVLYRWGFDLMNSAARRPHILDQLIQYRDGLLIAMLAAGGRRARAMAGLRVGEELIRVGDIYWIDLPISLNKTPVRDAFPLPPGLTPYIEHYLATVRPQLLQGRSEMVWISKRGQGLSQKSLQERIAVRSLARFGVAFGPHRFRHAVATTAALKMSDHKDLAASHLNITPGVAQTNYNRADQVEASRRFQAMLDGEHDGGPAR